MPSSSETPLSSHDVPWDVDMTAARPGDIVGVIRHRLLINRLVDPGEVAPRLPEGIRPHVTSTGGVIVGCCLIAIDAARPAPLPAIVGSRIRAAAHRISVDVGRHDAAPSQAVYVPRRHTDALAPVLLGGRIFPGMHDRADIELSRTDDTLRWSVRSRDHRPDSAGARFDIAVEADLSGSVETSSEIADVVIGTVLGVSPGPRPGSLEAADMCPAVTTAHRVELRFLQSDFLESFETAEPAETLLMTDVGVTWRRSADAVQQGQ